MPPDLRSIRAMPAASCLKPPPVRREAFGERPDWAIGKCPNSQTRPCHVSEASFKFQGLLVLAVVFVVKQSLLSTKSLLRQCSCWRFLISKLAAPCVVKHAIAHAATDGCSPTWSGRPWTGGSSVRFCNTLFLIASPLAPVVAGGCPALCPLSFLPIPAAGNRSTRRLGMKAATGGGLLTSRPGPLRSMPCSVKVLQCCHPRHGKAQRRVSRFQA